MLQGTRVLDFSQYLPGPHASMRLGDLGAEIIKIESPTGEPTRAMKSHDYEGDGYIFQAQNRNKKSIALNLKDKSDLSLACELISTADVILESFRPGVMDRLGLGYNDVKAMNPSIIYCSLSGYGQTGPYKSHAGHDLNFMALSGVLSQLKDSEGRPIHPSITFADLISGIVASESILGALLKKHKTGEGTFLDISIADVMVSLMGNHVRIEEDTGYGQGEQILNDELICYGLYETKDQRYVSLGALEPKFWDNFCDGIQRPEWKSQGFSKRIEQNRIFVELKQLFCSKTLKEWEEFSTKIDCCMAPVLETRELYDHPYVKNRKLMYNLWDSRQVVTHHPDLAVSLENTTAPPAFNQHKSEILSTLRDSLRN